MEDKSIELELTKACNPFPSVALTGDLKDGISLTQPKICSKCPLRECKNFYTISGGIVCNGLVEMYLNRTCKPALRKRLRPQKVKLESIQRWHQSAWTVSRVTNAIVEKRVNESIHSLHDINTAVRLVKSFASQMIQQFPGESDDEKIEAAPNEMKALYKSVLLLGRRLEMSSITANPEAAGFGQKRPTPVYKVFDLICRLFKEVAHWDGGKHINVYGSSFKTPPVYSSFETLALVLVDNAVKYCEKGQTVNILVNDVRDGVRVSVENPGPIVPEKYREEIFGKGFRTPFAKDLQSSGRGFGLYIARIIVKVHGFDLEYVPLKTGGSASPNMGINAFRFIVPD